MKRQLASMICLFAFCISGEGQAGGTNPALAHDSGVTSRALGKASSPTSPFSESVVDSVIYGKTYGQWAAEWVKWAQAGPEGANAMEDTTGEFCAANQPNGKAWFLAGTLGTTGVERTCSIPQGRALFYPLIELSWVDCPGSPDEEVTDQQVRDLLAGVIDSSCEITSTLDDTPIPSLQIVTERSQSPKFSAVLPEDNVFRNSCTPPLPSGRTGRMLVDGYWVMIPPLSSGTHTLTLHGAACSSGAVTFENGVTYHLTVK